MPLNNGLYRAVSKCCISDQSIESIAKAYIHHFETATRLSYDGHSKKRDTHTLNFDITLAALSPATIVNYIKFLTGPRRKWNMDKHLRGIQHGQRMIGISKLYCGTVEPSDPLRYGRHSRNLPPHLLQFASDKKPVVVWNMTRACNLNCMHCYARAVHLGRERELTTAQGLDLLDDLATFGVPVILFSGGEPLLRPDLIELAKHAVASGMRAVLSTNGTGKTKGFASPFSSLWGRAFERPIHKDRP